MKLHIPLYLKIILFDKNFIDKTFKINVITNDKLIIEKPYTLKHWVLNKNKFIYTQ